MTQDRHVNCAWVEERIDPYVDGDLDSSERTVLENHLGTCATCRREMALAESVREGLRGLPAARCPDAVVDAVLGQAGNERHSAGRSTAWPARLLGGWRLRTALAAGIAAIVVVAAMLALRVNRTVEHFTPQEIEQAEAALRWTFAYVNDVSRRSGHAVRDEVFASGIVGPVERAMRSALHDNEKERQNQQQPKKNGESL